MVKIRLKRMGAHKKPFYRIVVADSRTQRDGRFIEELGYYDPLKEPPVIKVDGERATYWIGQGAQPTDVVRDLLRKQGLIEGGSKKQKIAKPVSSEKEETVEQASEEVAEAAIVDAPEDTVENAEETVAEAVEEAPEEVTEESAE